MHRGRHGTSTSVAVSNERERVLAERRTRGGIPSSGRRAGVGRGAAHRILDGTTVKLHVRSGEREAGRSCGGLAHVDVEGNGRRRRRRRLRGTTYPHSEDGARRRRCCWAAKRRGGMVETRGRARVLLMTRTGHATLYVVEVTKSRGGKCAGAGEDATRR